MRPVPSGDGHGGDGGHLLLGATAHVLKLAVHLGGPA